MLARDYRNGRPYAGRDVLVVGTGSTGTEIAADLAEHGATRSGWPCARRRTSSAATCWAGPRRAPASSCVACPRLVDRVAHGLAAVQEPDLSAYGMREPTRACTPRVLVGRVPVQDVGIVDAIRTRRVEPVAAVESVGGAEVVLTDGTRLRPDAVLVAAGYRAGLEPLVGHLGVLGGRGLPVVHGAHEPPGAPGLWFTGFTNPISRMLRELRIDAERIAAAIAR